MIFFKKSWTLWTMLKFGFFISLTCVLLFLLLMWRANSAAKSAGEGILFDDVDVLPKDSAERVALVFGCSRLIHGRENLYFKYRINAAYELWQAKKVRGFIVSGDNSRDDYNEPEDMKQALIEKGVPAEKIVCDFAGLRTLDSVVRVQKIFGENDVIFVSQKFHNERAAYIALKRSINAIGYNAKDVTTSSNTHRREYLARVRMWTDENIFHTKPKHLGEQEKLGF